MDGISGPPMGSGVRVLWTGKLLKWKKMNHIANVVIFYKKARTTIRSWPRLLQNLEYFLKEKHTKDTKLTHIVFDLEKIKNKTKKNRVRSEVKCTPAQVASSAAVNSFPAAFASPLVRCTHPPARTKIHKEIKLANETKRKLNGNLLQARKRWFRFIWLDEWSPQIEISAVKL